MKKIFSVIVAVMTATVMLTSCTPKSTETTESSSKTETTSSETSVSLKDDFYTAVNEEWLNSVTVSEENLFIRYSDKGKENIEKFYSNYVETLSSRKDLSEEEQKLLILYEQFLTNQTDKNKDILKEYTDKINKAQTLKDIETFYCDKKLSLYNGLLNFEISSNNNSYVLELDAISITGINLTKNPNMYNEQMKKLYAEKLENLFSECDIYSKEELSDMITKAVDLEAEVAQCFVESNTNKKERTLYTDGTFLFNIDIEKIFESSGYDKDYCKIVCNDSYMELLNEKLFTEENVDNLKAYLTVTVLCRIIRNSQTVSESGEVSFSDIAKYYMNDVLTKGYLKQNITEEDVRNITDMAEKIKSVYQSKIDSITYLSDKTKEKAKNKLDKLGVIVAYPKMLTDYSKATINSENSYIENCENCLIEKAKEQNKILKSKYTKEKLIFDTMEINAYNSFGNNCIIINAGILQSPVYDRNNSFEENLGGIGIIVAHEVSHTLDINGSEYDENGNYSTWWNGEDRKLYVENVMKLKNFVSQQGEKDGIELNATQTKGEDIADLTGIQCCVEVLKDVKNADYRQFFINYATMYREKCTDEVTTARIKYDTHTLGKYRVNVPLQQISEFYSTFAVKEGDGMYIPENERISVW